MNQFYRREPRTNIWPDTNIWPRREPRTNIWPDRVSFVHTRRGIRISFVHTRRGPAAPAHNLAHTAVAFKRNDNKTLKTKQKENVPEETQLLLGA